MQLLDAEVDWLDGVLITHEHADHTHGIDDLRPLFVHKRRRVDVYLDEPTSRADARPLRLLLRDAAGQRISADRHRAARWCPASPVTIEGQGGPIAALPVLQDHGDIPSLGFRFGNLAYSADLKGLPAESIAALAGLDVWIVDALRTNAASKPFQSRRSAGLDRAVKPKRAILTNLHADLDYATLAPSCRRASSRATTGCRLPVKAPWPPAVRLALER